ncbi:MAG: exo-alpha-sialidase [Firmicutes bacterium]|nr:exo-alpha-sialidase [Bacillota bacterium]
MAQVLILVGTRKGAFIVEGDEARDRWEVRGPYCEAWPILHVSYDPASRTLFAVGGSAWYGPAVWRSRDLGRTWTLSSRGLTYGDDGPRLSRLWHVTAAHGSIYVGAEPAGLFRSDDGGEGFVHVAGLRRHPTCPQWEPGNGGLCLHSIVVHPTDPRQIWVAASSVGTFYTADGGETWEALNRGLRADYLPPEQRGAEVGYCVHKLRMAPGRPERLYQQNHQGVYRSDDGGRTWQWITDGLPSAFGFPLAVHPRDPDTLYVIPLNGDDRGRYMPDGRAAVWRSRDAGATWERLSEGLPQAHAYLGVLREAMATDPLPTPGVYFGTTTGQLFYSRDEGESWAMVPAFFPPINSVDVAVVPS